MFHISRMVIGASGGIDSAVSAALYAEAIGPENVFLVNMPTRFNSDTTKNAARDLAENLGTPYMVAPISDIIESICHTLERCSFVRNDTEMKVVGINHENLQARTRSASILSTVASIVGAGVTCNGNKSEAMVGYCTLYGDTCGVMCALGDLWKTQVYALARYINRDKEIIPKASIDIPASAELSEAMNVDEGKGDPILYPYHDKLFAMWVEKGVSLAYTEKLLMEGTLCETLGVDEAYFKSKLPTTEAALEDMRHWYRRFKGLALAKRIQFPPILSLSGHAFGGEYHESQV
jgi:NAD+ synthase (glutamine-hydrolysing)